MRRIFGSSRTWAHVSLSSIALLFGNSALAEGGRAETVKVGTLAPAESPWGQVFKIWQRAVRERTKLPEGQKTADGKTSALEVTFFYNGQQGDEAAMVAKMKSGQLDAAALTAVGLGQIHPSILALQLPGVFKGWENLDRARDALKPEFEKALKDAGFSIPGWGDVGISHVMSKGFAVQVPGDLRGKKPYIWREDPVTPALYQVVGGATMVPLGVPEVLPNLNTGAVNVLITPSLAAEQLQWASRLDHINLMPFSTYIGAIVLTNKKLESLPADQRAILAETAKVAAQALTTRIRSEDAAALERVRQKMEVHTPTDAQVEQWNDAYKQVRARLSPKPFSKELVDKVESLGK